MSVEPTYRLELTERESTDVLDALSAWIEHGKPWNDVDRRMYALYQKIGALEPIGTSSTEAG